MRKYRNWLIGFGVGIIIGASMLQMILVAKDQSAMVAQESLTRDQLDAEAEKAGLVLLTEEQLNDKVEEAVAASQEQSNKGDDNGQEGIKDSDDEALKTPAPSDSPVPEESGPASTDDNGQEVTEPVFLRVDYGMTLTEVADELKKLGLIDDAKDFINEARPISKKMKVGKSEFTGKPTYEQIMNELTRKK
ncbi:hypothetical protein [Cohnella lupini]|uniref:YceG-like family protein n=1 Tax=Cohnella lupini TaxID=1294267 RepID=A0A3D9IWS4_9BACL|nr:hypothetical protein [Cohnella lupini]RED66057.1 hypothetical protein DFP95_101555 [Cohnella lupini]